MTTAKTAIRAAETTYHGNAEMALAHTIQGLEALLAFQKKCHWSQLAWVVEKFQNALVVCWRIRTKTAEGLEKKVIELGRKLRLGSDVSGRWQFHQSFLNSMWLTRNDIVHGRFDESHVVPEAVLAMFETLMLESACTLRKRLELEAPNIWHGLIKNPEITRAIERVMQNRSVAHDPVYGLGSYPYTIAGFCLPCRDCSANTFSPETRTCHCCLHEEAVFVCSHHKGHAYVKEQRPWLASLSSREKTTHVCSACFTGLGKGRECEIRERTIASGYKSPIVLGSSDWPATCGICRFWTFSREVGWCFACGADQQRVDQELARLGLVQCDGCTEVCVPRIEGGVSYSMCSDCVSDFWPRCKACRKRNAPHEIVVIQDGSYLCLTCVKKRTLKCAVCYELFEFDEFVTNSVCCETCDVVVDSRPHCPKCASHVLEAHQAMEEAWQYGSQLLAKSRRKRNRLTRRQVVRVLGDHVGPLLKGTPYAAWEPAYHE